jgi:hypothetical protein
MDEFEYLDLSLDLTTIWDTLEIILIFCILILLMILTATGRLVRSCLASDLTQRYI